jgi:hypothetical protein
MGSLIALAPPCLVWSAKMHDDQLPSIPDNVPIDQWKAAWAIDHDMLHCTECLAGQFVHLSNHDFARDQECSRFGFVQRPWEDLVRFISDPRYTWSE